MKSITRFIIAVLIICCAGLLSAAEMTVVEKPAYLDDMIKIQLSADAVKGLDLPTGLYEEVRAFGHNDLDALLQKLGGTAVIRAHRGLKDKAWEAKTGFDRWFLIRLDGSLSAPEALTIAKTSPWIESASLELLAYLQTVPNDPYYNQNWGHNNTGQGPGGGGSGFDSNAPQAWDDSQGFGQPDAIVAIIDSGVNYNHPDLNDNCVPGYDYGSNDSNPIDADGHGSQCAGVAAAETNNGIGIAGVAGGCKIMPLKAMNNSGDLTFTGITNCITHAADNGAHVISLSLGAESNTDEGDYPSCDTALYYAYNAGITIFAATA
ncbi:MAG TPA: S8 family serine peptidase, partial [Candidatus Cloacimonadota bacterium]|nr:S8 family serine peptidase [Candidatus Cloacimonadota bacterium]